jgi:hypothetical protein
MTGRILPRDFRAAIPPSTTWLPRPDLYVGHVAFQRSIRELWYAAPVAGLAKALGRPHSTARAWATGYRRPPADVLRAVARWLRQHANVMLELALLLDSAAASRDREPRRLYGVWGKYLNIDR